MPPFTSSAVPARRTVLFLHDAVDTVGRDCEQPVLQPFDPSLLAQIPQMKLEIVRREAENLFQLNETHTTALQILSSFRVQERQNAIEESLVTFISGLFRPFIEGHQCVRVGVFAAAVMGCSRRIRKNLAGSEDLDKTRGITCLPIIGMILASENFAGAVEGLSNIGGELKNFVKVLRVSGVFLCDHRISRNNTSRDWRHCARRAIFGTGTI